MPSPNFNPSIVMLAELNKWLDASPFEKFVIITSSGKVYEIPSPDHLTITRLLHQIFVERDDGSSAVINPLHIAAIEKLPASAA